MLQDRTLLAARLGALILPVLLMLSGPGPALAQSLAFGAGKTDPKAPVEIAADQMSVNQNTGKASFSGNVVIAQGEMRLSAPQVEVSYAGADRRRIQTLHATGGKVTLVSGPDAAEAQDAVYDVAGGQVRLTGDVLVTQGQNVMTGNEMTLNLTDGTAQVSGRVRSVLQPGSAP